MNKFYKINGSKYHINHDFFKSIETEEQAYLLGFYVADGNINEKRKTFRVKIQKTVHYFYQERNLNSNKKTPRSYRRQLRIVTRRE